MSLIYNEAIAEKQTGRVIFMKFKIAHKAFYHSYDIASLAIAAFIAAMASGMPGSAQATPAFAIQTSQPCAACHVGAYGPQLTPYGRDFKLYGYVSDDGRKHWPPLAIMARGTFTNIRNKEPDSSVPAGFRPNNNFAIGEVSLFYTGKVTEHMGVYLEPFSYDGVARSTGWANSDIRYEHDGRLAGVDYVAGLDANNAPAVTDLWNATNQWGWPFDVPNSGLAPAPAASTLLGDGQAQFQVVGAGGYALLDDWVYLEMQLYHGLSAGTRNFVGDIPVTGTDSYEGAMPYWRASVQHNFDDDHQSAEIGTLGMIGNVYPGGVNNGFADRKTDLGADANYQWFSQDNNHIISAHALYMHENLELNNSVLSGANPSDELQEFRTNVSYAYKNTWIPTVGYFSTWGSSDPVYWNTSTGSSYPNSSGYTAELAFVPWGEQDSPIEWGNVRFELQYTAYTEFDGTHVHASDNNTIFFNIGIFFDPMEPIKTAVEGNSGSSSK